MNYAALNNLRPKLNCSLLYLTKAKLQRPKVNNSLQQIDLWPIKAPPHYGNNALGQSNLRSKGRNNKYLLLIEVDVCVSRGFGNGFLFYSRIISWGSEIEDQKYIKEL